MRLSLILALLTAMSAQAGVEDPAGFDRYRIILDRKPFGDAAAASAESEAAQSAPNPNALSATLRLVALEQDENTDQFRAGIVDGPGKKHHFLTVGQEEEGLALLEVDFSGDRARIRKNGQEEWLTMATGATASAAPPPTRPLLVRPNAPPAALSGSGALPTSLMARRAAMLREQAARQLKVTVSANPPPGIEPEP